MANLTIVVDDVVLRRARQRAIEDRTSISAEVRTFLLRYARDRTGFEGFLALSEQLDASSRFDPGGPEGPDGPDGPGRAGEADA